MFGVINRFFGRFGEVGLVILRHLVKVSRRTDDSGPPGHLWVTNLDEKDMPDRFQALPGVKSGFRNSKIDDFGIK